MDKIDDKTVEAPVIKELDDPVSRLEEFASSLMSEGTSLKYGDFREKVRDAEGAYRRARREYKESNPSDLDTIDAYDKKFGKAYETITIKKIREEQEEAKLSLLL